MSWSNQVNYSLVSSRSSKTNTFFNPSPVQKAYRVERVREKIYESAGLDAGTAQAEASTGDAYTTETDNTGKRTTTQTVIEAVRANPAGGWTARKTVTITESFTEYI